MQHLNQNQSDSLQVVVPQINSNHATPTLSLTNLIVAYLVMLIYRNKEGLNILNFQGLERCVGV